jgi:hypothetical protein
MIGLYRLAPPYIQHELGLTLKAIARALEALKLLEFAIYDATSAYVWVYRMFRFRLHMKADEVLLPHDNRVPAVNRLYHGIDPNPFLGEFFDQNARTLGLRQRRDSFGLCTTLLDTTTYRPFKGVADPLRRGRATPSKPGTDVQVQVQQVQVQERTRRLASPPPVEPVENSTTNPRVIRAVAADVLQHAPSDSTFTDLKELAKAACAQRHIPYDATLVGSALEQAIARHAKEDR